MQNTIIPLNIYQTWFTKNLEPGMKRSIEHLKNQNKEFNVFLYDDNDCKKFIKDNFDTEVFDAFNNLIPGAYRADLWRYCILYKLGGIYIDVKYTTNNFKLINLVDKSYFVKDRPNHWIKNTIGIYNAFMVSEPNNIILKKAIDKIVENVKNLEYGYNSLYPTGPGLLGSFFDKDQEFDLYFSECGRYINYKNNKILKCYENYREEQQRTQPYPYYGKLWHQKLIYKNNLTDKYGNNLITRNLAFSTFYNIIPLNIYQLNYDFEINKKIENKMNKIKKNNLEFGYFLFNIYDCGEFIRKNFEYKIYKCFNNLKTMKCKVDLWKYCILYKNGGIYIDINFNLKEGVKLLNFVFKNFYVKYDDENLLMSEIIITEPNNEILLKCIHKIYSNYENNDWEYMNGDKILTSFVDPIDIKNQELIFKNNIILHDENIIVESIDNNYNDLHKNAIEI